MQSQNNPLQDKNNSTPTNNETDVATNSTATASTPNTPRLCEKFLIHKSEISEDQPRSDTWRLGAALERVGVENVRVELQALRQLYPAAREGDITATVIYTGRESVVSRIEAGDHTNTNYGIACDYGSTTIVMQLVDLISGNVVAQASEFNGQSQFGSDILTRITYTLEGGEANRAYLQKVTAQTFNTVIESLEKQSGISRNEVSLLIISGNTTMQHFLMGLDAWSVFSAPYSPITLEAGMFGANELGIDIPGKVYFIPGASNYVGGDIMSGLLNLDFYHKDEVGLFFDIGTNGELVMGNSQWLMAGAGAAGPALEGYGSKYGTRAKPGAVDTVSISSGVLTYTTIDSVAPCGICGSGIIDLLAQMRLAGWIDIAGELVESASDRIVKVWENEREQLAVVYATASESEQGEDLYFTQYDIEQYIECKAAAHTMMDCILDSAGISYQDVDHLYLTGAFGIHSDLESAITIGIFPDLPRERFTALPNASLDGARALLLNAELLDTLRYLIQNIFCVQFASMPNFMLNMRASKFVPHTNMEEYPTVKEELTKRGLI